jgi:hypothetical protein
MGLPSATPTPSPTAVPTPAGPLTVSPSALSFIGVSDQLTVTVSEAGYNGGFAVDATGCGAAATVSALTAAAPGAQFTVTSVASGTCTVTVSDGLNQKQQIPVTVTVTSGGLQ